MKKEERLHLEQQVENLRMLGDSYESCEWAVRTAIERFVSVYQTMSSFAKSHQSIYVLSLVGKLADVHNDLVSQTQSINSEKELKMALIDQGSDQEV